MSLIDRIEQEQMKSDVVDFRVGDTVNVHTRVVEGGKERIQIFTGIVIGRRGRGLHQAFTVRKISYGEGVERVFPLHSPKVARVEVTRRGKVRRAKLNYLRQRVGKKATQVRAAEGKAALGGRKGQTGGQRAGETAAAKAQESPAKDSALEGAE